MGKLKFRHVPILLLLVISNCSGLKSNKINITIKIKTGRINVYEAADELYLDVLKNDGSMLRSTLHAVNHKENFLEREKFFRIDHDDCEAKTTCIATSVFSKIKIKADLDSEIINVLYTTTENNLIKTCYLFENDTDWFGGPQRKYQRWPIQHGWFEETAYVPSASQNMAVAERYWLSSKGIYIFVSERDPLFVDQNSLENNKLCLIAKNEKPYRRRNVVTLSYQIGVFSDPRKAHENVIQKHFKKPIGYPDERMVEYPIWSTWARYKVNVSDEVVKKFANKILEHGFNHSQIEIDDNWEDCYGSAKFNPVKFRNVKELVEDLKKIGFRVTLWIHPFINRFCRNGESYFFARKKQFFVKNTKGSDHTTWWQGHLSAGIIDFTNKKAVDWWVQRLKQLEKIGFDSFKFDAGETDWLPKVANLSGPEDLQPGIYTYNYTTNLAKYFNNKIEVRAGWRTQDLPIFVRMSDKDTTWTWNNGLPTLITTLLQMNLNGYVFVLPDMIGGNGYFDSSKLPSKEMFIRWLQANVFMPTLQFSFAPWDYDNETITISKTFTKLHTDISPTIIKLMKKAVATGSPINPPIWWIDPSNSQAHNINDEFLLGEEILVAPVVKENSVKRDIYLPAGKWKDANHETIYDGPVNLKDYSAPLNILPFFFKVL